MKPFLGVNITEDKNKEKFNGEEWGIYFPCYELPVFERLTGLKAERVE